MANEPIPKPTFDEVERAFRQTREKVRQIEERTRRELPRKPPGDDDPGTAPPANPSAIPPRH